MHAIIAFMRAEGPVPYEPVSRDGRPFVIGATGGIGPHYVARLAETSEVFAGYRKPQDRERLAAMHPNVIPVVADLTKPETLQVVFDQGVTDVFSVGASLSQIDMTEGKKVNVTGIENLVREADGHARHVHHLSTRAVYGHQQEFPIKEDAVHHGVEAYAGTKSRGEKVITEGDHDFSWSVLRPGDVIGPDLDTWTHLFLNIIQGIELSDDSQFQPWSRRLNRLGIKRVPLPLAVMSLITNGAVFTPVEVENLVDRSMLSVANREAEGQVFNAVDTHSTFGDMINAYSEGVLGRRIHNPSLTVVDAATGALSRVTDFTGRKLHQPILLEISDYLGNYELDGSKVRDVLGYEPRVSLEESIAQTKDYVDKHGIIRTRRLYK
jgi:nucleoside-diphosphate-sugar epimerase